MYIINLLANNKIQRKIINNNITINSNRTLIQTEQQIAVNARDLSGHR